MKKRRGIREVGKKVRDEAAARRGPSPALFGKEDRSPRKTSSKTIKERFLEEKVTKRIVEIYLYEKLENSHLFGAAKATK